MVKLWMYDITSDVMVNAAMNEKSVMLRSRYVALDEVSALHPNEVHG